MTSVAWGMMQNMGWKEGEGLGKEGQGLKVALKPSKKIDNAGLGTTGRSTKWIESCCAYDSILAKLNQKYGDNQQLPESSESESDSAKATKASEETPSKKVKRADETKEERRQRRAEKRQRKEARRQRREARAAAASAEQQDTMEQDDEQTKKSKTDKKSKKEAKEETKTESRKRKSEQIKASESSSEESADDKPIPVARHIIYAKRHKAKQVACYSSENKAEIFALDMRAAKAEALKMVPFGSQPSMMAAMAANVVAETSEDDEAEEGEKGQVGTYVDGDDDEEEGEWDGEDDGANNKRRITYENGFTEDTQVDIYNEAAEKQIKGRMGLGTMKKLSKTQRRERAQKEASLMKIGSYLAKKFVYAGTLDQMTVRKA